VIGWMLTSVTAAEWTAFAIGIAVAAAIFVFRQRSAQSVRPFQVVD